jgi:hypothetical protein
MKNVIKAFAIFAVIGGAVACSEKTGTEGATTETPVTEVAAPIADSMATTVGAAMDSAATTVGAAADSLKAAVKK